MPDEKIMGTEDEAIQRMKIALSKLETPKGRLHGLSYQPRPNDIGIATTPKAGTTWMQQIVYQLKTGGDMDFDEISNVVPWIELAYDLDNNLEAKQVGEDQGMPRFFKTHCWEQHCPKFPKVIVVIRHPYDVVYSFYRFFEDWFFQPGEISLDSFIQEFWLTRDTPDSELVNASFFHHLVSWYQRRNEKGILFVCYEDLKDDLRGQIRRVARFISNDEHNFDQPDLIDIVVEHSKFDFMKQYEHKFLDSRTKKKRNLVCGLPADAGMTSGKVVEGVVGKGRANISDHVKALIDERWGKVVEPATGCKTYEALRMQMHELSISRND